METVFQTPHRPYRAVPLRYWQSDNRTSTAVLPPLRATQKGNLARPHSRSPQAVRQPGGPAMHCHLHRGDWSFLLTNEKKKKIHGRYVRYMEGTSDTWKVRQIHGRYLRYMEGTSDTWKVRQIHGRYLRYMEGSSDTWKVHQIHGRCLRYMEGTSDTWKVPQIQ